MDIKTMIKDLNNARQTIRQAEWERKQLKAQLYDYLISIFPGTQPLTAYELSDLSGIAPCDIATILAKHRCQGRKKITRKFVLMKEDGTIDPNQRVYKEYTACLYSRYVLSSK